MTPRIAVVGAGKWGLNVIAACRKLGALCMVGDICAENLAHVRHLYPDLAAVADIGALMRADVEAVAIASSAPTHFDLTLQALQSGKDVFVEKPLALRVSDAEAIAAAAQRLGRKVFVGHLLLYHPAVNALSAAIRAGRIGSVVHLRSRRLGPGRIRTNENVWWSFAPHDIAVMLELLGEPAAVAAGQHAAVQPGIADFAYADFRFHAGSTAHVEVCWLDPDKSSRIDVFGTAGVISAETARPHATLTFRSLTTRPAKGGIVPGDFGEPETIAFPAADPLGSELRAFLDWVAGGPTPPTDVAHGVNVVRALAAADEAAQHGSTCGDKFALSAFASSAGLPAPAALPRSA